MCSRSGSVHRWRARWWEEASRVSAFSDGLHHACIARRHRGIPIHLNASATSSPSPSSPPWRPQPKRTPRHHSPTQSMKAATHAASAPAAPNPTRPYTDPASAAARSATSTKTASQHGLPTPKSVPATYASIRTHLRKCTRRTCRGGCSGRTSITLGRCGGGRGTHALTRTMMGTSPHSLTISFLFPCESVQQIFIVIRPR